LHKAFFGKVCKAAESNSTCLWILETQRYCGEGGEGKTKAKVVELPTLRAEDLA
jgi:hypothetical protein